MGKTTPSFLEVFHRMNGPARNRLMVVRHKKKVAVLALKCVRLTLAGGLAGDPHHAGAVGTDWIFGHGRALVVQAN